MYAAAVERFGGLDIVVANSRGNLDRARVDEGEAEGWVATSELNLIGAFYTMREAVPHLKERGAGRVISVRRCQMTGMSKDVLQAERALV